MNIKLAKFLDLYRLFQQFLDSVMDYLISKELSIFYR